MSNSWKGIVGFKQAGDNIKSTGRKMHGMQSLPSLLAYRHIKVYGHLAPAEHICEFFSF
jgi:hypothetical protein